MTDSVFRWTATSAPLADIVSLAERYDAWIDRRGARGRRLRRERRGSRGEDAGLGDRITVRMGTLGKALGSYGAFVAGSRALIELLVNRARAYVYSTALPPPVIAAAEAAVAIARGDVERRRDLWDNAPACMRPRARRRGDAKPLASPIVPLVVGGAAEALAVASRARRRRARAGDPSADGSWGTARLRLTPIATHAAAQIGDAVDVLGRAVQGGEG